MACESLPNNLGKILQNCKRKFSGVKMGFSGNKWIFRLRKIKRKLLRLSNKMATLHAKWRPKCMVILLKFVNHWFLSTFFCLSGKIKSLATSLFNLALNLKT